MAKHRPTYGSVLRQATPFALPAELVASCLAPANEEQWWPGDNLFSRAWNAGPAVLTRSERNAMAPHCGHIAESVTAMLFDDVGWANAFGHEKSGVHGVDLILQSPDENVVAFEVKATFTSGRIPRLSRRELVQLSSSWLDKADNPGMAELELTSEDVYGAIVVMNFADRTWRAAFTADFETLVPVVELDDLQAVGRLTST